MSDWVHTGAAARGWRSLVRWAAQVAGGALFVALGVRVEGSPQQLAARAAQALCGTPMSEHGHTFFGLSHAPFSKEVADADLWLPASKQSLMQQVLDTLQERHSVPLVGEPGVGKTCVLREAARRKRKLVDSDLARSVLDPQPSSIA